MPLLEQLKAAKLLAITEYWSLMCMQNHKQARHQFATPSSQQVQLAETNEQTRCDCKVSVLAHGMQCSYHSIPFYEILTDVAIREL